MPKFTKNRNSAALEVARANRDNGRSAEYTLNMFAVLGVDANLAEVAVYVAFNEEES